MKQFLMKLWRSLCWYVAVMVVAAVVDARSALLFGIVFGWYCSVGYRSRFSITRLMRFRWPRLPTRRKPTAKEIGDAGEQWVEDVLKEALPDDFRLFRNIRIPNKRSKTGTTEIDLLAVGDSGLYNIEVKNYSGNIHIVDQPKWPVTRGRTTHPMRNPVRQSISQKLALEHWLKSNSVHVRVNPVVIFVGGRATLTFHFRPDVPIYQAITDMVLDINELPAPKQGRRIRDRIIRELDALSVPSSSKPGPVPMAFSRSLSATR